MLPFAICHSIDVQAAANLRYNYGLKSQQQAFKTMQKDSEVTPREDSDFRATPPHAMPFTHAAICISLSSGIS